MCQKGGAVTDGHGGGALGMLWVFEPRPGVVALRAAGARVCTLLVRGCGLTGRSAPCAV